MEKEGEIKTDKSRWVILTLAVLIFTSTLRRIFRTPVRRIMGRFHARFLENFQTKYNERMRSRKEALFHDGLSQMTKDAGRPLRVLEIGAGSGANFAYYPDGTTVSCLDPNPASSNYLTKNAGCYPRIHMEKFHVGFAENMSEFESGSVDAVVCSLVLCSVRDVDRSLQEIIRVLKPGGKFFFMEHVVANSGTTIYRLQHALNWLWSRLTHCNLTRKTYDNIHRAGFGKVELDVFEANELIQPSPILRFISLVKFHTSGIATK